MDDTSIEGEVVHVGGRRVRARRPVITALASVPESTSSTRQKDEPAAHEVINLWRNLNAVQSDRYNHRKGRLFRVNEPGTEIQERMG